MITLVAMLVLCIGLTIHVVGPIVGVVLGVCCALGAVVYWVRSRYTLERSK